MNLQDFKYVVAVATHRHFGRAAESCHVSQPTLSGQIRKLEEELGVTIFERTNKRVDLTVAGEQIIQHAQQALAAAAQVEEVARAARDPLVGPLRLGIIPTLAPYLMPLILAPLREKHAGLSLNLWEDTTRILLDMVRHHRLDAAIIATPVEEPELTGIALFTEPLLAALPPNHALTEQPSVNEHDLASDLLVLADGHCLSNQTLEACNRKQHINNGMQAAGLETLVNLVAAGYGTTLIPTLAAPSLINRGITVRPLSGGSKRVIHLVSRPAFARPQALRALEKVITKTIPKHLAN